MSTRPRSYPRRHRLPQASQRYGYGQQVNIRYSFAAGHTLNDLPAKFCLHSLTTQGNRTCVARINSAVVATHLRFTCSVQLR